MNVLLDMEPDTRPEQMPATSVASLTVSIRFKSILGCEELLFPSG